MNEYLKYLTSFEFNSTLAVFTYWIPLAVCGAVYAFRFIATYRRDLSKCTEKYYTPELTIGAIVGHILLAITPCINLFAMVFDCASSVYLWLGRVLDAPLVAKRHTPDL